MQTVQNTAAAFKIAHSTCRMSLGMGEELISALIDLYDQVKSHVKGMPELTDAAKAAIAKQYPGEKASITTVAKYAEKLSESIKAKWKLVMGLKVWTTVGSMDVGAFVTFGNFLDVIAKRRWKADPTHSGEPPSNLVHLTSTSQEYRELIVSYNLMFFVQYMQFARWAYLSVFPFN